MISSSAVNEISYKNGFVFDLDGTLTDSGPGIMNCVKYMLEHYGITEYTEAQLRACVGPPLTESFMRFWGFDYPTSLEAVEVYRERYKPIGIFENSVYDGIPEALRAFRDAGARLYVATSKPTFMAERVLEHFGLREYFTEIAGATASEGVSPLAAQLRISQSTSAPLPESDTVPVPMPPRGIFTRRRNSPSYVRRTGQSAAPAHAATITPKTNEARLRFIASYYSKRSR